MRWWRKQKRKKSETEPEPELKLSHTAMPGDISDAALVGTDEQSTAPATPVYRYPTVNKFISNKGIITIAQQDREVGTGDLVYLGETYQNFGFLPTAPDDTYRFRETPFVVVFLDVRGGKVARISYLD